jgi:RNA polymerase sigma-70 factor, ECF subfamily
VRHRRERGSGPGRGEASFDADLAAARRGDSEGFTGLYRRLDREVLGFARARGAEDPDGVVNETFVRAFRRLRSFDGTEADFRSWVFAIGRNLLIDETRRKRRRPQISADEPTPDPPAQATVEDEILVGFETEMIVDLLGTLTEDQRDVVTLRVLGDLSLREVAEILDKPIGAVKSLQHRAFGSLARRISGEAVSSPVDRTLS